MLSSQPECDGTSTVSIVSGLTMSALPTSASSAEPSELSTPASQSRLSESLLDAIDNYLIFISSCISSASVTSTRLSPEIVACCAWLYSDAVDAVQSIWITAKEFVPNPAYRHRLAKPLIGLLLQIVSNEFFVNRETSTPAAESTENASLQMDEEPTENVNQDVEHRDEVTDTARALSEEHRRTSHDVSRRSTHRTTSSSSVVRFGPHLGEAIFSIFATLPSLGDLSSISPSNRHLEIDAYIAKKQQACKLIVDDQSPRMPR